MTLPMTTYEDTVGTRIRLINYERMAYIIARVVEDEPQQVKYLLQEWGQTIYKLGQGNEPPVHVIQPLKPVAGD